MRVDCKCQAKSNVHLTESQIKTVKARSKPKLWTGVPLIEMSAVKGELTAMQCSPYQTVTSKATLLTWLPLLEGFHIIFKILYEVLKKYATCDPRRSRKSMNKLCEKALYDTQLFFAWATHFGKRTLKIE